MREGGGPHAQLSNADDATDTSTLRESLLRQWVLAADSPAVNAGLAR